MSIRLLRYALHLVIVGICAVASLHYLKAQNQNQPQIYAGRNINMVSGTRQPGETDPRRVVLGGNPYLQRQNEPSIAVSTRNPLHLFAGANDYRTVDIPGSKGEEELVRLKNAGASEAVMLAVVSPAPFLGNNAAGTHLPANNPTPTLKAQDGTMIGVQATSRSPEEIARLLAEQGKVVTISARQGKVKQIIEKNERTYLLPFGESKAILFKLPDYTAPYELKITSLANFNGPAVSIFVPFATFFNAQFEQTRELDESKFTRNNQKILADISIGSESKSDRYLLVFTRGDLVGQKLGRIKTWEALLINRKGDYICLRSSHGTLELETVMPKQ